MKCFVIGPNGASKDRRLSFWCPGCKNMMQVCPERWHWNNDTEKPTLAPSILQTVGPFPDGRKEICHCFVKEGEIEFCGDSTHALAGKKMPLPDIESVIDLHMEEDGSCWWTRKTQP